MAGLISFLRSTSTAKISLQLGGLVPLLPLTGGVAVLVSVKLLASYFLPVQGESICCIFRDFKSVVSSEI